MPDIASLPGASLSPAPRVVQDDQQRARYGSHEGIIEDTSLDAIAGALGMGRARRIASEKGWQWFGALNERWAVGGALVRTGYAAQVFLWCCDRKREEMVWDRSATLPLVAVQRSDRLSDGLVARARWVQGQIAITRHEHGEVTIEGRWAGVTLQLMMTPTQPALTAISPVPGDRTNVTVKQVGLAARGVVSWGDAKERAVFGANSIGLLDHTHGLLARETSWRWAIGAGHSTCGKRIGFNFVEGFNEGAENGVWVDHTLHGELGAARFSFDASRPQRPWRVEAADGQIALELEVEAVRAEDVWLGVVTSRYAQPIGRWRGRIGEFELGSGCVGVAEDHEARW